MSVTTYAHRPTLCPPTGLTNLPIINGVGSARMKDPGIANFLSVTTHGSSQLSATNFCNTSQVLYGLVSHHNSEQKHYRLNNKRCLNLRGAQSPYVL